MGHELHLQVVLRGQSHHGRHAGGAGVHGQLRVGAAAQPQQPAAAAARPSRRGQRHKAEQATADGGVQHGAGRVAGAAAGSSGGGGGGWGERGVGRGHGDGMRGGYAQGAALHVIDGGAVDLGSGSRRAACDRYPRHGPERTCC